MSLRVLVLSSLIAAATITIVLAGPPVLAPADGSPIRIDRPNHVAVGDVNKDGHPDLVVATQTSAVAVFLGRGNGQFAPAPFGDKPQRHREHRDSYVLLCVLCAPVAEFSVP